MTLTGLNYDFANMPTPLNICMISDDFIPCKTGVGVHVKHISKELVARGHTVVVITTRRKGEPKFEEWEGVKVYRLFSIKVLDFHVAVPRKSTIRQILMDNRIDVVHYHYLGFLLKQTYAVAKKLGLRQVYTYNMTVEHLTQGSCLMKCFSSSISKSIIKFCNACDLIMVPSHQLIDEIQSREIQTRTEYVSNAVGFDDRLITHRKTSDNRFKVLYVGRLHPEKNVSYLINGFKSFRDQYFNNDSELWIIGDGSLKNQLKKQCYKLKITANVKFWSHIEQTKLTEYYANADLFVLPSLVETQGMAAIEAMYCGLPIIVTDKIISAHDLVENEVNGFIVNHKNPHDLAYKLDQLYNDPFLRKKMGSKSKAMSSKFSTVKIGEQIENIYSNLIGSSN